MERIETIGSFWFLDDGRYMRTPKEERPRDSREWPYDAPALDDARWIGHNGWYVSMERGAPELFIHTVESTHRIHAPLWVEEYERLRDLGHTRPERFDVV